MDNYIQNQKEIFERQSSKKQFERKMSLKFYNENNSINSPHTLTDRYINSPISFTRGMKVISSRPPSNIHHKSVSARRLSL